MKLVDTQAGLREAAAALAGADLFYIDTEFEARREGTRLCLLQISRGDEIFLVDALRLGPLTELAPVLGGDGTTWVLHAGQQDVPLITSRLALRAPPELFDTQIAWALLGPEHSVSLAYLVYRVLGVRTGKSHQADDWQRRPLPEAQLAYAAGDIEHLPAIHRELEARALKLGRAEIVREASAEAVWPEPEPPSTLSLESFRNAWQLDRASQAALRFLIDWYNALPPRERERAPETKTLLAIAGRLPESGAELARIKGVPRRWAAEDGDRFTGRLLRATAQAKSDEFVPIAPPPYTTFDDIRTSGWLSHARAEVCARQGVAPELAFPGRVLRRMQEAVAKSGQRSAGADALTGWRARLLADAYREFCAEAP